MQVSPPTILSGQPPLTINGKSPAILYYGAEYCPYCAAERWAMTAALSRFGTWSNLKITASSHTDVDAETNTFSFHGASFTSPYITFTGHRAVSTCPTPAATTTAAEPHQGRAAIVTKYENLEVHRRCFLQRGDLASPSSTSTTWPSYGRQLRPGHPGRP